MTRRRPPVSRTVEGHVARKRYGQNFLADPHYVARIADAVAPQPGDTVVEIGPGLGALTGDLIERAGPHRRDRDRPRPRGAAARALRRGPAPAGRRRRARRRLRVAGRSLRVVGNLPYNISSPILFRLAAQADALRDVTVMLQKEVVARMTAEPGTAEYGRLTVMLGATFAVERLFVVPPGAFRPPPKVDSAVARLTPLGAAQARHRRPRTLRERGRRGVLAATEDAAQCAVVAGHARAVRRRRHRSRSGAARRCRSRSSSRFRPASRSATRRSVPASAQDRSRPAAAYCRPGPRR